MEYLQNYNQMKLGFNRRAFIEEILNQDFQGNIQRCAKCLNISKNYLYELLHDTSKEAGCMTLTKIWRYALTQEKSPWNYIFVKENNLLEKEAASDECRSAD